MKKLSKAKWFKKLQRKCFPPLVKVVMRFVLWTSKIELIGVEKYYEVVEKHPTIIMLWHNRIVLCPNFFGEYMKPTSNYTAYVSESRDGEWLALATESYPNGYTIRVPKFDKHKSLRAFIKTLKKSVVLITPDGPLGPPYKMKPGIIVAAQLAKAQLIPFSWSASKYWRIRSWDKMIIPKPFGKVVIGYGEPFFVNASKDLSIEQKAEEAEQRLNAFRKEINQRLSQAQYVNQATLTE